MNLTMSTNSYLEYYLTLLGWIVNNGFWNAILDTGLFAAPLGAIILQEWLSARQQGADEGNKAMLSIPRVENRLWLAFIILMFACTPMVPLSLSSLAVDDQASQRCGITVAKPSETAWGATFSTIGGKSATVPPWWYLVHTISKGIAAAGTAALPCRPDVRQIRMEIDEARIDDQILLQEVADFTNECYAYARARLFTNRPSLTKGQNYAVSWIGSSYFLETPGYYDRYHSRMPRKDWPYDEVRDAGLARLPNGAGFPTCTQWWSDSGIGLRDRLLAQVDPRLLTKLRGWLTGRSSREIEEATLRELVSPRQQALTMAPGEVYQNYGSSSRGGTVAHGVNNVATNIGLAFGSMSNHSAMNAMRTALPMIQAVLLMGVIICLPLVMVISTYQLKVVMMLSFALFTLHMLTFWWELARWIDSSMLDTLYHHVTTGDRVLFTLPSAAVMDGTVAAQVIAYVMGAMFIVLPILFVSAMSWAGYAIGNAVGGALTKGSETAEISGASATKAMTDKATRKR